MTKQKLADKKKLLRQQDHFTQPPRMEGVVRNAKINPVKKPKKATKLSPNVDISVAE